jgi:Bacterial cellulose synthase subunit
VKSNVVRALALVAVFGLLPALVAPAGATDVTIPLSELGYRDGVTVAGVAPSVTFDLPRYASLQAATLKLQLHVSAAADPQSTIAVAVNGERAYTRTLREIGNDPRLMIPLPLPPGNAQLFAVTVSGALSVAGDRCAADSSRKLFLRVGRDSSLAVRTASGGSAEAFFRDYRGSIAVSSATDDPELVAVPYRLDRLEPWHRLNATLAAAAPRGGRALVLAPDVPTTRHGDILRIAPGAFAALPVPRGQTPVRADGRVAFGDLRQHLGSATGIGDLAFDVPLLGSVTGGVPRGLVVHVAVSHSALPSGATGTLQVLVNGVLSGARELGRDAATQTMDVAVPQSVVGPSNNARVLVAPDIPAGACAGASDAVTAALLDSSSFSWSSVGRRPPSIESFLTALNGRVIVLVAPEFTRAAFHLMGEIGKMNAAIVQLDVARYDGRVPDGYDYAIVFAPPEKLGGFALPVRADEPVFTLVNPTDDRDVFAAGPAATFALLELGEAHGTPLLAVSYHGTPGGIVALEQVDAAQLATQVAGLTVVNGAGVTTYDVGEKLRPQYPGDVTVAEIWSRIRLYVALALLALIVAGGVYASRRLTGRTLT